MQQRIKEFFTDDLVKTNAFVREIYKEVRNKSKKLANIEKIEDKTRQGLPINNEEKEKLSNKQNLTARLDNIMKTMELYRETMKQDMPKAVESGAQEKIKGQKGKEANLETQSALKDVKAVSLDNESNVVEVSIS
jgi:ATP-dependent Lon protease